MQLRLRTGTRLWRVHSVHRAAEAMNPTAHPDATRGGRFDSRDGSYAYLYLGNTQQAALAETLTRDLPLDGGPRLLPHRALVGHRLSEVEVSTGITVVSLHGAALTQLGQDTWLTKSDARDYELTRAWADAIRSWAPKAGGFSYRCRHDEDQIDHVLFTTPAITTHPRLTPTGTSIELDSPHGHTLVRGILAHYNAALSR